MSVLVQIMAWRRAGDKPIIWINNRWSSLLVHICVTLPGWVPDIFQIHFLFQKTDEEIHLTKIRIVNSHLLKQTRIFHRHLDKLARHNFELSFRRNIVFQTNWYQILTRRVSRPQEPTAANTFNTLEDVSGRWPYLQPYYTLRLYLLRNECIS